jgi:hypothetical protein
LTSKWASMRCWLSFSSSLYAASKSGSSAILYKFMPCRVNVWLGIRNLQPAWFDLTHLGRTPWTLLGRAIEHPHLPAHLYL